MNRDGLRTGLLLSSLSIAWTLFSSVAAVAVGLASASLVLVAFGLTGLLDAAGSVALVVHFRHALLHETFSEKHERVAFLVVTSGLIVVALFTLGESIHRLVNGAHSEASTAGIVIASLSLCILSVLAVAKRRVGAAIPSDALKADGVLSGTGAGLAAITIVGASLTDAGVWWADPIAAALVGGFALSIAAALHVNN